MLTWVAKKPTFLSMLLDVDPRAQLSGQNPEKLESEVHTNWVKRALIKIMKIELLKT